MGLTDIVRSLAFSAALALPVSNCTTNNYYGSDGEGPDSAYTCESGARMVEDECCGDPRFNEYRCSTPHQVQEKLTEECLESLASGSSTIEAYQRFFNCVYGICHTGDGSASEFDRCQEVLYAE